MKLNSILLPGVESKRPWVISGPCSAETEEQVMQVANELSAMGVKMFRAGVWKPRTKPGGFEGVGTVGLKWLQKVRQQTGMYVATEVATKKHVIEALRYDIDILWIGARTTANPFAVQEIADALKGIDVPLFIKNPVSADLELWIGAFERFYNAGITRMAAIHRGFSTADKSVYRNLPQWHIPIELKRRYPNLPIFSDPSHIGGNRSLIQRIAQQAMDLNFKGLIIESHCTPDDAWSDSNQQITPIELKAVLNTLVIRDTTHFSKVLSALRTQIDEIDYQLIEMLNKRMDISRQIGAYKINHKMPILQTQRYNQILNSRVKQAEGMGMSALFAKRILEIIHEESVRQQMNIMQSNKSDKNSNK